MKEEPKWKLTDPDTEQYGRQHSKFMFEFKEKRKEPSAIDLSGYTYGEIEDTINSYGYTLYNSEKGLENIKELYGNNADWIIAECIFETE
jgi:hypothetical protein